MLWNDDEYKSALKDSMLAPSMLKLKLNILQEEYRHIHFEHYTLNNIRNNKVNINYVISKFNEDENDFIFNRYKISFIYNILLLLTILSI